MTEPSDRHVIEAGRPLDVTGAVLSVVGLTSLVAAIIEGPERGWTDPLVIGATETGWTAPPWPAALPCCWG